MMRVVKRHEQLRAIVDTCIREGRQVKCSRPDFIRIVRPWLELKRRAPDVDWREDRYILAEIVRLEWLHDYHYWSLRCA